MKETWRHPDIKPLGKTAILITWEEEINEDLLYFILEIKKLISETNPKDKLEVINTYNSLLINYPSTIKNIYSEKKRLKELIYDNKNTAELEIHLFTLPVCYDKEFGVDLDEVCRQKNLEYTELVQLHSSPIYTIYFTGFLPGFLYLGGLDERLKIPRKKEPRLKVKKGAVGLAENQTGIYPQKSAGGWQIIGNCPVNIFDVNRQPPSYFKPGDKLKFKKVSKTIYNRIQTEIEKGHYQIKSEPYKL